MDEHSESSLYSRIASDDFENALRKGFWRAVISWLNKSSNQLLPFDEVRKYLPIHGQYEVGVREIPLDKIVGSVGRYNDFDRAFLPRQRHTKSRWMSIDLANLKEISLPPIEVYKIGEVYFVRDGNHRVSVARRKGQKFIDASVIEVVTNLPITETTDIDELICLNESDYFQKTTQIKTLRPDADIHLCFPGQYEKLLEHINVHRWYMGEKFQREVSFEEAVAGWYDEVYLPLVRVIEEQGILKDFPNRTVADLYLWIIEHLYFLREEFQQEVSIDQAATHFKSEFSPGFVRRLLSLFRKFSRRLATGLEDAADLELGILSEDMLIDPSPPQDDQKTPPDHKPPKPEDLPND